MAEDVKIICNRSEIVPCPYTYTETTEPIEQEEPEEDKN